MSLIRFTQSVSLLLLGWLLCGATPVQHSPLGIRHVFLDAKKNVRILRNNGEIIQLTSAGRYADPKMAGDRKTLGWLVISQLEVSTNTWHETHSVRERLVIYRNGRMIRTIRPDGFIRSWGFWNAGKHVAIYSGALHFAGFYTLVEVGTGRVVAESQDPQTDGSPDWVRSLP